MRVGLIGAGRWGQNILATLSADSDITISYIAHNGRAETRDRLLAWQKTTHPTTVITTRAEDVFDDPAVDTVCIATPIDTHPSLVRAALLAKKHVFVEKPLAASAEEVADLYQLAASMDRTLYTGYLYLHNRAFKDITLAIDGSSDIELEFSWLRHGTFNAPLIDNLLVHDLALAAHLLGTLTLKDVIRNEDNYIDLMVAGERGHAHIIIDRDAGEHVKEKRLTVRAGSEEYRCLFDEPNVLDTEITDFKSETILGSTGNKKRQRIDESIAAVLEELKR